MNRTFFQSFILTAMMMFSTSEVVTTAKAAETTGTAATEAEANARKIFAKLVAQTVSNNNIDWSDVELEIVDYVVFNGAKELHNAGAWIKRGDGKIRPMVTITRGYLDIFENDEHGLALVFGHELGHHACGHTIKDGTFKTHALAVMHGHQREAEADQFGAKLLLKAGYSLKKASRAMYKAMTRIDNLYSSVDGTKYSHPGRTDRLARIAALADSNEETLWRSMAAFENGNTFLILEDYAAAEACFLRVTKEFPNCGEAWTNLGMARLRRYCDSLGAQDLSRLGVGQFVAGVRFKAARSLLLRSGSNVLLKDAVFALERARVLIPKAAIVRVGLGIAALVESERLADAEGFFAEALALVNSGDSELDGATQAALLMNRGVVRLADGRTGAGEDLILQAQVLSNKVGGPFAQEIQSAVLFNTAIALTADGKKSAAVQVYERYLRMNSPSNPWWAVAYERYSRLNESLGEKPLSRAHLGMSGVTLRLNATVHLSAGTIIAIGESMDDVSAKLGQPTRVTPDQGTGLQRLSYTQHGIDVLADADEVFAIIIVADAGPALTLRESGLNGKARGEIRPGMTRSAVEALPGGTDWIEKPFSNLARTFPYYPQLGAALIYDGDGPNAKVLSILIGSIPKEGTGKID